MTARHERYRVLAFYGLWNAIPQFEWLRFAPIADVTATTYGITLGQVGFLSMLYPLLFLPLALPSGWMLNKISVRTALRLVSTLVAAGAILRILIPGFAGLVVAQVIFAITQPLQLAMITKVIAAWFDEPEKLLATSLGTMSQFSGIAIAFVVVPMTAPSPIHSLHGDALVLASLCAASWLAVPRDPRSSVVPADTHWWKVAAAILKKPAVGAILVAMFLGNGFFGSVFSWLAAILHPHGISAQQAGSIGLLILLGGIAGMVGVGFSNFRRRYIPVFIAISAAVGIPMTLIVLRGGNFPILCTAAFLLGMLALSPLPLMVDALSARVGVALSASAVSIFWLAGNAGSTIVMATLSFLAGEEVGTAVVCVLVSLLACEVAVAGLFLRLD